MLANIIPVVRSACSVIGVKCVWRVQGGLAGIQSAWSHINIKKNECDTVVFKTPGVAFFFSAVSTYQPTKRNQKMENEQPSDEEIDEELPSSQDSVLSSQVNQTSNRPVQVSLLATPIAMMKTTSYQYS